MEIVGGTWGQIPLEKKFELAEKALYRSAQKADESSESDLSRCDVTWTELLSKKVDLKELQAYIVLRGSKLGHEDKKRVIVESKAEQGDQLTMDNVTSAIRLLGSGFFQEYTGARRDVKSSKNYDHTAFQVDEDWDADHEIFATQDDMPEDEILETLAAENDEDAILVMQFEDSIADTIQSDSELAAFYSTYQDARRRLSERVKVRGFWPVSKRFDKGFGKKGKGKSKGKNPFSGSGGLARRIANSFCRICMQKGHWKNECPQKNLQNTSGQSNSTASNSIPTSFVIAEETPIEFAHLAVDDAQDQHDMEVCFGVTHNGDRLRGDKIIRGIQSGVAAFASRFNALWRHRLRTMKSSEPAPKDACAKGQQVLSADSLSHRVPESSCNEVLFATSGTVGIVDLGASQTVVGDQQIPELLAGLPSSIRNQVTRTNCSLTFRFGNQQTLSCRHALLLPLGSMKFRIAIVPGRTPFLISSTFLKGIRAVIDTDKGTLWSKALNKELLIEPNQKNLYTMDINQLWENPLNGQQVQESDATGLTCATESSQKMLSGSEAPHHEKISVEGQRLHEVHDMSHAPTMPRNPMSLPSQNQRSDQSKSAVSFVSAQVFDPIDNQCAHEFQDEQRPTTAEGIPRVSAEVHRSVRTDQNPEDEPGRAVQPRRLPLERQRWVSPSKRHSRMPHGRTGLCRPTRKARNLLINSTSSMSRSA